MAEELYYILIVIGLACVIIGGASFFIALKIGEEHKLQKFFSKVFVFAFIIIGAIAALCLLANVFGILTWFVK